MIIIKYQQKTNKKLIASIIYNTNKQKNTNYQNHENLKRNLNNYTINSNKRKKINNIDESEMKTNENALIEPNNFKDIFKFKDKIKWLNAVKKELEIMKNLNVYKIVRTVPSGSNIISSRWVFKYKRDAS